MKKPLITTVVFVLAVLTISFLSSCTTTKGYNYQSHNHKNKSVMSKAKHRNAGRDMVDFKCTNKH
jgi:hypothetical protein